MKNIVENLKKEKSVIFTAHGNSMSPKIENGETIEVSSSVANLKIGDVVLCKVHGRYYIHLIKSMKTEKNGKVKYLISNNKGHENGWIGIKSIFGKKI